MEKMMKANQLHYNRLQEVRANTLGTNGKRGSLRREIKVTKEQNGNFRPEKCNN